jgi:MFS family permease
LLLTVREPQRGRYDLTPVELPPLRRALGLLWQSRSFRWLTLAGALNAYVQHTMLVWNAPFYSRVFSMSLTQVAEYLALMNGIGGAIGIYVGGFFADYWGQRDARGFLLMPALGIFITIPFGLVQYLTPNASLSLACGMITSAAVVFYFAPIVSAAHMLVLPRMRALTSAVLVLIVNLIGVGLGPLVTGVLSDVIAKSPGLATTSLRYAISSAFIVAAVSALLWWRAAQHFTRERQPVRAEEEANNEEINNKKTDNTAAALSATEVIAGSGVAAAAPVSAQAS